MKKIIYSLLLSLPLLADITYLNEIREDAKLNILLENTALKKSAKNHVTYLYQNDLHISHEQTKKNFFSGRWPWDRALYTGYGTSIVSENISEGPETHTESVDMLMLAIYHRFGFLDFNIDEVGIFKNDNIFVYNMGNSYIRKACDKDGDLSVEFCETKKMKKSEAPNVYKIEKNNPDYVIYPPENSYYNLPAFYDETPNPVPDLKASGNPISIQFNPSKTNSVEIIKFEIRDGEELLKSRLLTAKNDPNKKFKKFEYALFPLERLNFGRIYKVLLKAEVNGKPFNKSWTFGTRTLNGTIYSITSLYPVSLTENKKYYLSLDPNYFGRITKYETTCGKFEFVDYNTLGITYQNPCYLKINGRILQLKTTTTL